MRWQEHCTCDGNGEASVLRNVYHLIRHIHITHNARSVHRLLIGADGDARVRERVL
jgi:hypothetical protein